MRSSLALGSFSIVALAGCVAACSSSSSGTTNDAGDSSVGTDVGDGSHGGFACPSAIPKAGSPCETPAPGVYVCEYGGDSHGACTRTAQCSFASGGSTQAWIVSEPAVDCPKNAPSCPAKFGDREGTKCTPSVDPTCDFDEGRCGCLPCQSDAGYTGAWHCRTWSDVPAPCPSTRPLLGSACSSEGLQCDYDQCCRGPSVGPNMICQDGTWSSYVSGGCSCLLPTCP